MVETGSLEKLPRHVSAKALTDFLKNTLRISIWYCSLALQKVNKQNALSIQKNVTKTCALNQPTLAKVWVPA